MLTRIEALNFRSLRYVSLELSAFQVLLGPNSSGKSTFLDVVNFLSDLVSYRRGVEAAVENRVPDLRDLTFKRQEDWFELAVEAAVPRDSATQESHGGPSHLRYEVRIGIDENSEELARINETLWGIAPREPPPSQPYQRQLFPYPPKPPETILWSRRSPDGAKKIVHHLPETGNDFVSSETTNKRVTIKLGPLQSALASLPFDETECPAGSWFRAFLSDGVQRIALHSEALRKPSSPTARRRFLPDGSNLPWVAERLREDNPQRYKDWIAHVQTALPDLVDISTVERSDDRHRYLVLKLRTGLEVPSWLISDGTLRLLALTLLAYAPTGNRLFLIEEPENGIHPRAVETVFQSLSSAYDAQVFLATHSPVILSLATPEIVLCFARTSEGATDIVRGNEHPKLAEWRGDTDLGTLFASGVLG